MFSWWLQGVDTGDSLRITFDDVEDSDGIYTVSSAGTVSLPYLNEVVVRGLTLPEVQAKIEGEFRSAGIFSKPEVNVQPAQFRPYYVLGEVNQPGEFEFRQGMTVQAAISAAGGYTYRAKTSQDEVTRTIDGVDIAGVDLRSLRSRVALVTMRPQPAGSVHWMKAKVLSRWEHPVSFSRPVAATNLTLKPRCTPFVMRYRGAGTKWV